MGTSAAQTRIINAALLLFGQHGVGGTSLQMIADEIGVTKAAVYHQYKTKEEIVRAVALAEFDRVEAMLDVAEAESSPSRIRDAAIRGIVDLSVERRRQTSTILTDPIVGRIFAADRRLARLLDRLNRDLLGDKAGPDTALTTAMLTAAISGAVMHPLVVNRNDEVLRRELTNLIRRFLGLRVTHQTAAV